MRQQTLLTAVTMHAQLAVCSGISLLHCNCWICHRNVFVTCCLRLFGSVLWFEAVVWYNKFGSRYCCNVYSVVAMLSRSSLLLMVCRQSSQSCTMLTVLLTPLIQAFKWYQPTSSWCAVCNISECQAHALVTKLQTVTMLSLSKLAFAGSAPSQAMSLSL